MPEAVSTCGAKTTAGFCSRIAATTSSIGAGAKGAWRPWDRAALDRKGLRTAARLGLPVGLTVAFESWAFSISTLMAGWLGRDALAGHQIVLNVAALSFMVPLGISQSAATRVGNLIGAGCRPILRTSSRMRLITDCRR